MELGGIQIRDFGPTPGLWTGVQSDAAQQRCDFMHIWAQNVRISLFALLSVVNHCYKVERSILCNIGT